MNAKIVCKSKAANDNGTLITVSDGIKTWSKNINSNLEAVFDVPGKVKYTISLSRNGIVETKQVGVGLGGYAEVEFGLDKTTWKGLKNIVNAHVESSYCKIGDEITEILSTGEQVTFRIAAINHDSAHQLIFESKYCLETGKPMYHTNGFTGGWNDTEIRAWLNNIFYNYLSIDLKNAITERVKKRSAGNGSNLLVSAADKIWLPTEKEVYGLRKYAASTEFQQNDLNKFPIYKTPSDRIKTFGKNGAMTYWWLSSPDASRNGIFCDVTTEGDAPYSSWVEAAYGMAPCFQIVANS